MTSVPITTINDRPVIVLTDELLALLNASVGDEVRAVTSQHGIELIANPTVAEQIAVARRVMDEDHEALKKLAE